MVAFRFVEARLGLETASLAAGCEAVCVFVNDRVDADTLERLAEAGVRMVALRCAGFNNVDLVAARRLGISVADVERLFDINHASKIEQIDAALAVLGKRLAVEMREAA